MGSPIFLFKKIISLLLFPAGLLVIMLALALAFWRRRPRLARGILALALVFLWLAATPMVSRQAALPLEGAAGEYLDPVSLKDITHVVALSGGQRQGEKEPGERLTAQSLRRTLEGVRIWRALPEAKLLFSGGNSPGEGARGSEAYAMLQLAHQLGVPQDAALLEWRSADTAEQARYCRPVLGDSRFVLVTSALHMPRALLHFRALGMRPIPAPCDFLTKDDSWGYHSILPGTGGLGLFQMAQKEYMGLAWAWLRIKLGF